MSFGGGSSAPSHTTSTVQQNTLPEYVRPYYETLLGQGQALTDINQNPWMSYTGARTAPFSPLQQSAFGRVENMQLPGQTTDASNIAYGTAQQSQNYQNYQPGQFYSGRFNQPDVAQSYMSPYIQSALAPTMAQMQEQSNQRQRQMGQEAQKAGAYGGYRQGIQQATEQLNAQRAMGDVYAQGMQNAYASAQQGFQSDAQRQLAEQQAYEQSRQFGGGLGLQGLGMGMQAAGTLGSMGQQQYGQEMGLTDAQMRSGAIQQDWLQQQLNNQYGDWQSAQNWPYRNLAFMSDIIGRPLTQSSTGMYAAPPSTSQTALGLGLGAYGLYGLFGGGAGAGKKKGGIVKLAGGGLMGRVTDTELTKLLNDRDPFKRFAAQKELEERNSLRRALPLPPQTTLPPESTGVGQLPAGDMNFKDGGIVGYQEGGMYKKWFPETEEEVAERRKTLDKLTPSALGGLGRIVTAPLRGAAEIIESGGAGLRALGIPVFTKESPRSRTKPISYPMDPPATKGGIDPYTAMGDLSAYGLGATAPAAALPEEAPPAPPPGKTQAQAQSELNEQMRAARERYEKRMTAATPAASTDKTPEQMYADLQGLEGLVKKDNPLYARREEMAAEHARQRSQDPYAAALLGAQAVINSPHRYPSGGTQEFLGPLAEAVTAGGIGQLKREKDTLQNKEKLLQLDAAIYEGDGKRAAHLQDQMVKQGINRETLNAHVTAAKIRAAEDVYGHDLAAIRAARHDATLERIADIRDKGGVTTKSATLLTATLRNYNTAVNSRLNTEYNAALRNPTMQTMLQNEAQRQAYKNDLFEKIKKDLSPQYRVLLRKYGKDLELSDEDINVLIEGEITSPAPTLRRDTDLTTAGG